MSARASKLPTPTLLDREEAARAALVSSGGGVMFAVTASDMNVVDFHRSTEAFA